MDAERWRYALLILREDLSTIGQVPVVPDWDPCREWLRLAALRRGMPADQALALDCRMEPVWHHERGEPYVESIRARASGHPVSSAQQQRYCADKSCRRTLQWSNERQGGPACFAEVKEEEPAVKPVTGDTQQNTPARPVAKGTTLRTPALKNDSYFRYEPITDTPHQALGSDVTAFKSNG